MLVGLWFIGTAGILMAIQIYRLEMRVAALEVNNGSVSTLT